MGVDACIYFKTRTGQMPDHLYSLPNGATVVDANEFAVAGSTHEIYQCWRYYGPGYERGPWPFIAAILIELMANEDVETVWYFGDSNDSDDPFTQERLEQYTRHYIEHGDRPYSDSFK